MTESSLLQEIEEDMQRKKMEALWNRYGPFILAAALAIVLGAAGFNGWKSYKMRSEQAATKAVFDLINAPKLEEERRIEKLEDFAATHAGIPLAYLARFQAADAALKAGKNDKALELYNALAQDASVEPAFRQMADLFAVQLQMDTGDAAELQTRLQPLLTEGPWKANAKELTAFLALKANDKAKAKQLFTELTTDANAPVSIAQRATDMQRWLTEDQETP